MYPYFADNCPGQKNFFVAKLGGSGDLPDLCYNVVVKQFTAKVGPQVRSQPFL